MTEAQVQDYIPRLFLRYVAHPLKLLFWIPPLLLLSLVILSHDSQVAEQATSSSDSSSYQSGLTGTETQKVVSLSISGEFQLALDAHSQGAQISQGGFAGSTATKDLSDPSANSIILKDSSGATQAILKEKEGEEGKFQEVYGADSKLLYVTKNTDEGYKILTSDRALLAKVKIKEDKFNIYSAEGTRTHYGKFKNSRISIRNDNGSDVASLSTSNSPSLKQISPLCLPIKEEARILLYLSFLYSEESW
jgi:hypothetical protein